MKIVFIADTHIKGLNDPAQKTLLEFLESLNASPPDKLVILGDLFDFWTGFNGIVYYHYFPVLSLLKKLRSRGIGIMYLEGNHDFSMGGFFTDFLAAEVYPDFSELTIKGRRIFLCHGDVIDKTPIYAIWRGFLRSPLFKLLTKLLTPSSLWRVASSLSKRSRTHSERYKGIERHLKEFAAKKIAEGYDIAIFGHSHIPTIEKEERGGRKGIYANPGSLSADRSYLVYTDGELRLERFPF